MGNEKLEQIATLLAIIVIIDSKSNGANNSQVGGIIKKRLHNRKYYNFVLCINKIIHEIQSYQTLTGRMILTVAKKYVSEMPGINTYELESIYKDLQQKNLIPKEFLKNGKEKC